VALRAKQQMTLPSKRLLLFSALASLLGGVALAAYEVNNLHRAMTAGYAIANAVADGLGERTSEITATVSVSLCFGLISMGRVDNPYLVIAVGDVILGTLITGCAIVFVYTLRAAFRRNNKQMPTDGLSAS
jgi:CHASE2 domain-containing sensor protein